MVNLKLLWLSIWHTHILLSLDHSLCKAPGARDAEHLPPLYFQGKFVALFPLLVYPPFFKRSISRHFLKEGFPANSGIQVKECSIGKNFGHLPYHPQIYSSTCKCTPTIQLLWLYGESCLKAFQEKLDITGRIPEARICMHVRVYQTGRRYNAHSTICPRNANKCMGAAPACMLDHQINLCRQSF